MFRVLVFFTVLLQTIFEIHSTSKTTAKQVMKTKRYTCTGWCAASGIFIFSQEIPW